MRRGRKPLGIDQVDRVPGSPLAKERLRVILANIAGELTIEDACDALGIEASRLFDLKRRCLEDWVELLEPKTPGRKPARPLRGADSNRRAGSADRAAGAGVESRSSSGRAGPGRSAAAGNTGTKKRGEIANAIQEFEVPDGPTTEASGGTSRGQQSHQHQEEARRAERVRRVRTVEFAQWARDQDWPATAAAAVIGLPRRTLSSWCRAWERR